MILTPRLLTPRLNLGTSDECNKRDTNASFLLTVPHCIFSEEELTRLFKNRAVSCGCHLLYGGGVVFQPDGSISLCNHLLDFKITDTDKALSILNSSESFLNFWNSDELAAIRKDANCFRSQECSACSHWDVCGAGCLVRWAHYKPEDVKFKTMNLISLPNINPC